MNITYSIKELGIKDCDSILSLYRSNPQYFEYYPPQPTIDTVKDDLVALPNNVDIANKHYLGFYDEENLLGIIDLITKYPDEHTCFIGLFMIDSKYQNKGLGSKIIEDIFVILKNKKYEYVKLAYILGNERAKAFWEKNGFVPIEERISNEQLKVMLCVRKL